MAKLEKIFSKKILSKLLKKDVILYIIFGILTTLVNLCSFYLLNIVLKFDENFANLISITVSVLFAYITNKDLVFHSNAKGIKEELNEFFKFVVGRLATMIIELIGGFILFNFPLPKNMTKIMLTIIVIILNFFISRFYIFQNRNNELKN